MAEITFKIATAPEELMAAREIRKKVFVLEQGIPEELDVDEDEERSMHLVAIAPNLKIIGTGRLTINQKTGVLSRISVTEEYRGKGVGKLIIMKLEALATEKGLTQLTLSPHSYLEDFYAGLGYAKDPGEKVVGSYTLLSMSKSIQL